MYLNVLNMNLAVVLISQMPPKKFREIFRFPLFSALRKQCIDHANIALTSVPPLTFEINVPVMTRKS